MSRLTHNWHLCLILALTACGVRPAPASPTISPTPAATAAQTAATDTHNLTGLIVYSAQNDIYVMNADGTVVTRLTTDLAADFDPAWSPDGRQIAFRSQRDGNDEIYVMQADGSQQTNLTQHPAGDWSPEWSPDGQRIVFSSQRGGDSQRNVYVIGLDGSGLANLTNDENEGEYPAWSPDGTRIAFACYQGGDGVTQDYDICLMNTDGSEQTNLTRHPANDFYPAWSPDGQQLAFYSERDGWPTLPDVVPPGYDANRGGNRDIYVVDVPIQASAAADGPLPARNVTNNPVRDDSFPDWPLDHWIIFSQEGCLSVLDLNVPNDVRTLPGNCDGNFPDGFVDGASVSITPLPSQTAMTGMANPGARSGRYPVTADGESGITGMFEVRDVGNGLTELSIELENAGEFNPWNIFELDSCDSRPAENVQPAISLPDIEQGAKSELVDSLSFHAFPGRLIVLILASANSGQVVACADLGLPVGGAPASSTGAAAP